MPETESPTALRTLDAAVASGREVIRSPPSLPCSKWAEAHFRLAPESSAVAGRFEPRPYQRDLLDLLANDSVRTVTVRKAARIGYTKCLLAALAFVIATRRRNVMLLQPTADDAKRFSKDSVRPMVRDVGPLTAALVGDRRSGNTLGMILFLGCSLEVRGGNTPNAYRRTQQDMVCFDEIDAFPTNIAGEGDPVALGDRRIADSPFAKSIRGSTPTTLGRSLLERCEAAAHLHLRFAVACPHCGERQPLEWGGPEATGGIKWRPNDPDSAYHACRACTEGWPYAALPTLLATGRWESDDGRYIADGRLLDAKGRSCEWPRDVAIHIWAAYCLSWSDIVRGFLAAKDDPDLLRVWTNTVLAEYWRDEAVDPVEPEPLLAAREPYRRPPAAALAVTFGVDVQQDRIECELVAWGPGEESWSLDYRVIRGNPTGRPIWNDLLGFVRTVFTTEDGRRIKARCGIVDSGYLTDEVYQFSRRAGLHFAIPGKGSNQLNQPIATLPRRLHRDHRVHICYVGTSAAKDVLFNRLHLEGEGPGRCHWPDTEPYDAEYFSQLGGEEKRPVKRRGRTVMAWTQCYARVEALDCRVYALAAIRLAQAQGWVSLTAPDSPRPPEPPPPTREPRRGGWVRPKR